MKFLSVCSGIEAASAAWTPLGWTPTDTNGSQTTAHHSADGHQRTRADAGGKNNGGGSGNSRKPARNPRSIAVAGNPASNHAPNFAPKTLGLFGGLRLVLPIFTAVLAVFAHSNGAVAGTSNGVLRVSARVEYGCNIAGKDVRCGGASGPASSVQLYPNPPASSPKFGAGVLEVVF